MAKVRVSALAKELGTDSKTLIAHLNSIGEYVKTASSTIEAPVVRKATETFPENLKKTPARGAAKKATPAAPAAPAARETAAETDARPAAGPAPAAPSVVEPARQAEVPAPAAQAPSAPAPSAPSVAAPAAAAPSAPAPSAPSAPAPSAPAPAAPAARSEAPAAREGGQQAGHPVAASWRCTASRCLGWLGRHLHGPTPRRSAPGQQPLRPLPGHAHRSRRGSPRGLPAPGQQPVRPEPGYAASAEPSRCCRTASRRHGRSGWTPSRWSASEPRHDARPQRGRSSR
ncbi:hypothetical protein GKE56_07610 [Nostocoides sp. HKS02]|nr:hypothetical protein GKE56_07610 [Tetrasphaera sp. HKS02]